MGKITNKIFGDKIDTERRWRALHRSSKKKVNSDGTMDRDNYEYIQKLMKKTEKVEENQQPRQKKVLAAKLLATVGATGVASRVLSNNKKENEKMKNGKATHLVKEAGKIEKFFGVKRDDRIRTKALTRKLKKLQAEENMARTPEQEEKWRKKVSNFRKRSNNHVELIQGNMFNNMKAGAAKGAMAGAAINASIAGLGAAGIIKGKNDKDKLDARGRGE